MSPSKSNGKKRNLRKSRECSAWIEMDITVNHFANNTKASNNIPKKLASSFVDKFSTMNLDDDDRAWDEKSDEEYEQEKVIGKGGKKRKKRSNQSEQEFGIFYPFDLWFLISDYIRPEDVSTFAAICKSTHYVVSTAKFWFSLYERYHNWNPEMPEELNRWNMDRVRGLRASVVRSLFYMYQPFMTRVATPAPLTTDPSQLIRSQCILQWHSNHSNVYKYYFKFWSGPNKKNRSPLNEQLPDLISRDSLVHFNPEENCTILEITTTGFSKVEMVVGQYMRIALLGLTTNLCNHRLKLEFTQAHLLISHISKTKGKKQVIPSSDIIIEPVRDVKVYPWWHPKYFQCQHIQEGKDGGDM